MEVSQKTENRMNISPSNSAPVYISEINKITKMIHTLFIAALVTVAKI